MAQVILSLRMITVPSRMGWTALFNFDRRADELSWLYSGTECSDFEDRSIATHPSDVARSVVRQLLAIVYSVVSRSYNGSKGLSR